MNGISAAAIMITKSTTTMPIHMPGWRLKSSQPSVIQLQPLPAGTAWPPGTKSPSSGTVVSATAALGAA